MNYPSLFLAKELIKTAFVIKKDAPTTLDEAILKCEKCDYKTVRKNYLDNHTRDKHSKSKIKCAKCDFSHAFPSRIKQHHNIVHLGKKRIRRWAHTCRIHSCQHYGKSTCEDLKQHSLFFCQKCDYSAKTNCELKIHSQGFHEGIVYSCEQCDYVSKRKSDFRKHILMKHTKKFVGCEEENCSYETYNKYMLQKHFETEHEGIGHPCIICGHILKSRDSLRSHILHSHDIKPFENGY